MMNLILLLVNRETLLRARSFSAVLLSSFLRL